MTGFIQKYKLQHIIPWSLLFVTWLYFRYDEYASPGQAALITLIKVFDIVLLVYLTNYLLVPKLLYKKKYLLFAAALLLLVVPTSLAKLALLDYIENPSAPLAVFTDFKTKVYDNILPHISLVIVGVSVKLLFDYFTSQKRLTELAKEKAEAELSFLKSQINPHFLFNSLNAVYFLIDRQNSDARQALHTFSDMLRYQLYEVNGEKIPVEKEIEYLKDYVYLQKLRRDDNYKVDFTCPPEVNNFSIEPLLLIPFVENAFKHISHFPGTGNFVKLSMEKRNGDFSFFISNSKERNGKTTEEHGGIGLNNVKRRLELLYPGRYTLTITDENEIYSVNLKLKLDQ